MRLPVPSATWWQHVWRLRRRWNDSWQILLQGSKRIILAGCQIRTVWMKVQSFLAEILHNFRVCCAVCGRALLFSGITTSLRPGHFLWSKKACKSTDFQTRPVFQVDHHVQLPQLCFFCACASNHVTVNTRALCRIYQGHLKYQRVRCL